MFELDITALLDVDMWPFSHSVAEGGQNAGSATWNAAVAFVTATPFLSMESTDDVRRYFAKFGAWSPDELSAMSHIEINALLLQFIAGDIREASDDDTLAGIDWEAYQRDAEAGRISGGMFRDGAGRVYVELSA